jgi:hypothetical protein
MLQSMLGRIRVYMHVHTVHGSSYTWKRAVEVLVSIQLDELALGDTDF